MIIVADILFYSAVTIMCLTSFLFVRGAMEDEKMGMRPTFAEDLIKWSLSFALVAIIVAIVLRWLAI